MAQEMIAIETGGEVAKVGKSFWDVVEDWLVELSGKTSEGKATGKKAKSSRTIETYRYAMQSFKNWLDAESITTPTLQTLKDWQAEVGKRPWSVATKNLHIAGVRSFFKWLSNERGLDNVAAGLEGWQNTKFHKRGFLNLAEMKELLAVIGTVTKAKLDAAKNQSQRERIILQGKRDQAILTALMCGGLRTIEISRLRVCDLTHDGGAEMLNVLGKGRDERETVKISRKVARVIRDWLDAREAVDVLTDDAPLFCSLGNNSFGEPITSLSVSRLCKEYLRAAGLKEKKYTATDDKGKKKTVSKPVTAHSLRGSCATNAFLAGATLDQVKQQLRHRNLSTTEIYLAESEKFKNPVSDIISDGIF